MEVYGIFFRYQILEGASKSVTDSFQGCIVFDCHDILGYNSCYTNSREYLDRTSYMNPPVSYKSKMCS